MRLVEEIIIVCIRPSGPKKACGTMDLLESMFEKKNVH